MIPKDMLKTEEAKNLWEQFYLNFEEEKKEDEINLLDKEKNMSKTTAYIKNQQTQNQTNNSQNKADKNITDEITQYILRQKQRNETRENKEQTSNEINQEQTIMKKYTHESDEEQKKYPFQAHTMQINNLLKTEQQKIKDDTKQEITNQIQKLDLHDITKYFKYKGIVGEESLACNIYLALLNNISFGVEGYSGSGKTFITDKLIELIEPKKIYRAELSSKMAMFYNQEKINESTIIYIPELQKALNDKTSPVSEIIKNITEGKDAKRIVTNKSNGGSDEYIISKDKTIIYTLALENTLKKDSEVARRFMRFMTDSSNEHFEEIHNYKANKRTQIFEEDDVQNLEKKLKHQINTLKDKTIQIIDPFSEYLIQFFPKTQKSVGYIDHYYNLVDASTKFHIQNRETIEIKDKLYAITSIEDHFQIHTTYYTEFIKSLNDFENNKQNNKQAQINWKQFYDFGKETLTKLQNTPNINNPYLVQNWECRQITNNKIYTKDHKTGELIQITTTEQ
ncbi:MAG: hypothetical protein ACLFN8_04575 [Candidatus Woesearchaeota archaeon]